MTHDAAWYAANGIDLVAGEAVAEIDRATRTVRGEHGTTRGYDLLLLATGSDPVMLPIPGAGLPGVVSFRTIADVGNNARRLPPRRTGSGDRRRIARAGSCPRTAPQWHGR